MVGATVSHYEILEKLGAGGMGTVYKARDLKLERTVALKFLPPDLTRDPEAKLRLLREARTASALQHRNICVVYDVDETDDGRMFISMECIEGQTLNKRLAGDPLVVPEVLNIATQLVSGLAVAHETGIVHRDLKPANVMLMRDGTVKILDFGLAQSKTGVHLSTPALLLGTAAYMSPEQARGEQVDHRTDIWSVGIMLYEMVTGRHPFRSEYEQATLYAIIHERHAAVRSLRPDLPAALGKIIDRCLEKSPEKRFPHAGALLEDLRRGGSDQRSSRDTGEKSIAVLPFADISPEKDNKYFSDGLTEEIIAKLSRLQRVKIVSQNSVMHYERGAKTTQQIAAELRVQFLLEGSVRKHGSHLRITTQLIDAGQDTYLWAETYTGTTDQIFDIQEDVAGRIVKALKVRLTPDDKRSLKRRSTADTGAYQLYLKGRFFWSKRTREALETAIRYFEEAIEKDRQFAPAWVGIADTYLLFTDFVGTERREAYDKARAALRNALTLDDRLAEAHASRGLLAMLSEWDWKAAYEEFQLAIHLSPNYATAHHWYAEWLSMHGRASEAIAEISRAVELDPLSPAALKDRGMIYYYHREYDNASDQARTALELDGNFALANRLLSLVYLAQGKHAEALAQHILWAGKTGNGPEQVAALALLKAAGGQTREARTLLSQCPDRESSAGNLARAVALVHIALGEVDTAFNWLERAYEARAESMGILLVDPKIDPLRSDSRFHSLASRVGLQQ
jgi:serine/threonine protein kinase/Tfp pilus assembly protein PilF